VVILCSTWTLSDRVHLPESSLEPSCETVSHFTFVGMGITLHYLFLLAVVLLFYLIITELFKQAFKLIMWDVNSSLVFFLLSLHICLPSQKTLLVLKPWLQRKRKARLVDNNSSFLKKGKVGQIRRGVDESIGNCRLKVFCLA
jgi:hypothetical protein